MDDEFWYCLKHHRVEGRDGCKKADRLGPYPTRDEAAHALDKVAQRNEEWDEQDARDKGDDAPEASAH